jgi:arginine repressor
MPRPKTNIPLEDIKGLKTLVNEHKTQEEIVSYYSKFGIHIDRSNISRKIKEMDEK